MSLPRFFIADLPWHELTERGRLFELKGEAFHHAIKVLRLTKGERLVLNNGKAQDFICTISEISDQAMQVQLEEVEENLSEAGPQIILWQGLPKGSKFEHIIEKTVELGVHRIVPVKSTRSLIKLDDKSSKNKQARWQNIAEAAAKQSGRGLVPEVALPYAWAAAIREVEADLSAQTSLAFVPWEEAKEPYLPQFLIANQTHIQTLQRIHFFIGPEGGLTADEIEMAFKAGVTPITLGKRILRTETAGPAVLAMLNVLLPSRMV